MPAPADHVASVGVLLLETKFPRLPGDIGNPATWLFPVHYRTVRGAVPDRVVRGRAAGLLPAFCQAADELTALGAAGITTSCGFMALYQRELAEHCKVPFAGSALLQIPLLERLLPVGRRVGVVTVDAASLSPAHFVAVGAPADTPLVGVSPDGEFSRVFLHNETVLNVDLARQDVLAAACQLIDRHPTVGAVLLECTNMPPYSDAVRLALGLPVYDMVTFIRWFQAGLTSRRC